MNILLFNFLLKIMRLKICCDCEPPLFFLRRGCIIPHPYGITLAAESIGADCTFHQNVTIGSNAEKYGTGGKPIIGNLVCIFVGATLSGNVIIGDRVIVAANAIVTKDVPSDSIVYGINEVKPLKKHHKEILDHQLYHCENIYKLIPGLSFNKGYIYINKNYIRTKYKMKGD